MKSRLYLPFFVLLVIILGITAIIMLRKTRSDRLGNEIATYSGSESCHPCHERFYQLWHDSHHGLAMQSVTRKFVENNIRSFNQEIKVGTDVFEVSLDGDTLVFKETNRSGETTEYPAYSNK